MSDCIDKVMRYGFYAGVLLLLWSIDSKLQTTVDLLILQTSMQLGITGAAPPTAPTSPSLLATDAVPCRAPRM